MRERERERECGDIVPSPGGYCSVPSAARIPSEQKWWHSNGRTVGWNCTVRIEWTLHLVLTRWTVGTSRGTEIQSELRETLHSNIPLGGAVSVGCGDTRGMFGDAVVESMSG